MTAQREREGDPKLALSAMAAVAGSPGTLRGTATRLRTVQKQVSDDSVALGKNVADTEQFWKRRAANSYRSAMVAKLLPYTTTHVKIVPAVVAACENLARALETAQREMSSAIDESHRVLLPIKPTDGAFPVAPVLNGEILLGEVCWGGAPDSPHLGQMSTEVDAKGHRYWVRYGGPDHVAAWLSMGKPAGALTVLVNRACAAFRTAREARLAFVHAIGGVREQLASLLYGAPTDAERAEDEQVGRKEKGNWKTGVQRTTTPFITTPDPEGRIINYRYGDPYQGGSVFYTDDPNWAPYMQRNGILRSVVRDALERRLAEALRNNPNAAEIPLEIRQNASIQNGYGTGYELLHGTEATVGDFHISGSATRLSPGRYEVTATYTWNDIIDPNHQYGADTAGNWAVGGGKPYDMHIRWTKKVIVTMDGSGNATFSGADGAWPTP